MIDAKVEKLESEMKADIKSIYKNINFINESMVAFKIHMGVAMDTIKKLNDYTHDRIHYLLNTDKGVELTLIDITGRLKSLDKFKTDSLADAKNWRNKIADYAFKFICAASLLVIGHFF